jgi:hypothetical protein
MGSVCALALVLVYRCTVGGVTTFSDRPCAPEAVPYQPDTSRVSTYDPPPASRTPAPALPPPKSPTRRRDASDADQVRHAAACDRIRNSLRDVAERMRAGYDVKQGERLRERKAKLERQRRAQKCR